MKNYNIFALRGDPEVTDYDVCDTLGLDPSLAGTPGINEAAIRKSHQENYKGYLAAGMPENQAMSQADSLADKTRNEIRSLMKA